MATGSDHGWGSHHFVVGGAVRGKRFYGTAPPLSVADTKDSAATTRQPVARGPRAFAAQHLGGPAPAATLARSVWRRQRRLARRAAQPGNFAAAGTRWTWRSWPKGWVAPGLGSAPVWRAGSAADLPDTRPAPLTNGSPGGNTVYGAGTPVNLAANTNVCMFCLRAVVFTTKKPVSYRLRPKILGFTPCCKRLHKWCNPLALSGVGSCTVVSDQSERLFFTHNPGVSSMHHVFKLAGEPPCAPAPPPKPVSLSTPTSKPTPTSARRSPPAGSERDAVSNGGRVEINAVADVAKNGDFFVKSKGTLIVDRPLARRA